MDVDMNVSRGAWQQRCSSRISRPAVFCDTTLTLVHSSMCSCSLAVVVSMGLGVSHSGWTTISMSPVNVLTGDSLTLTAHGFMTFLLSQCAGLRWLHRCFLEEILHCEGTAKVHGVPLLGPLRGQRIRRQNLPIQWLHWVSSWCVPRGRWSRPPMGSDFRQGQQRHLCDQVSRVCSICCTLSR